jgi:hypothetical protein
MHFYVILMQNIKQNFDLRFDDICNDVGVCNLVWIWLFGVNDRKIGNNLNLWRYMSDTFNVKKSALKK